MQDQNYLSYYRRVSAYITVFVFLAAATCGLVLGLVIEIIIG